MKSAENQISLGSLNWEVKYNQNYKVIHDQKEILTEVIKVNAISVMPVLAHLLVLVLMSHVRLM